MTLKIDSQASNKQTLKIEWSSPGCLPIENETILGSTQAQFFSLKDNQNDIETKNQGQEK